MSRTAYCFDLDGTLTSTEILPSIAAELGLSEEIATLTRITMEGWITFAESLRLRVAILGQVPLDVVRSIVDDIDLDPALEAFIRARPDECFVVTGNLDLWVGHLVGRLGCQGVTSRAKTRNGVVVLERVLDKGDAVKGLRTAGFDRIISVGDGSNDVPMFKESDVAIAFGGVHSPTQAAISEAEFVVHDAEALCSLLSTL